LTNKASGTLLFFGVLAAITTVVLITLAFTGHSPKETGPAIVSGILFISLWSMLIAVIAGRDD
jgi:hypothetical protein